jgi:hypothetical protein
MVDVRPGLRSQTLDLRPTPALQGDGEEVPVDALGIARGVIDLLRPHEPRIIRAVDGDLRHPHIAGDTGDGEGGAPAAVAIGAAADLVVKAAVARPHGPDRAVRRDGNRGKIILALGVAEPVQAGEPGHARARFGERRADGRRLIQMRGRELRRGPISSQSDAAENDDRG